MDKMPWLPLPVMLMAARGTPATRASMAPTDTAIAALRASFVHTCPPFCAMSVLVMGTRCSASPSSNSARSVSKASSKKAISSSGTVRAYSTSSLSVYCLICSHGSADACCAGASNTVSPFTRMQVMLVWLPSMVTSPSPLSVRTFARM